MIAWVIGPDSKVAPRVVTVDRIVGQTVFLSSGLAAGDRVVTDGQLRLAPGAAVTVEEHKRPPAAPLGEERRASGRG
jgi:multidrug efflux pump subunit AcrA (membrane-fusion protein)